MTPRSFSDETSPNAARVGERRVGVAAGCSQRLGRPGKRAARFSSSVVARCSSTAWSAARAAGCRWPSSAPRSPGRSAAPLSAPRMAGSSTGTSPPTRPWSRTPAASPRTSRNRSRRTARTATTALGKWMEEPGCGGPRRQALRGDPPGRLDVARRHRWETASGTAASRWPESTWSRRGFRAEKLGESFSMLEEWFSLMHFAKDLHVSWCRTARGWTRAPAADRRCYDRPPSPRRGPAWPGRVFYTSLGHREDVWSSKTFEQILLGGLSWAWAGSKPTSRPTSTRLPRGRTTS